MRGNMAFPVRPPDNVLHKPLFRTGHLLGRGSSANRGRGRGSPVGGGSSSGCDLHRLHCHRHSALQEVRARGERKKDIWFLQIFSKDAFGRRLNRMKLGNRQVWSMYIDAYTSTHHWPHWFIFFALTPLWLHETLLKCWKDVLRKWWTHYWMVFTVVNALDLYSTFQDSP